MLNSISELIEKHLAPYHYAGNNEVRAQICPVCHGGNSGDQYTFSVNLDTGAYHCFRGNCNSSGGIVKLARMFGEEIRGLTQDMNIKMKTSYDYPKVKIKERTQPINDYFESRGIHEETLDAFKVGADEKGNIVFPFYVSDELTFAKFRKPRKPEKNEPKEWAVPNTRPVLFGMDMCKTDMPLCITEGLIDAMSLYEAGARNVVSVPSGCENMKWIEECWDWLERFDNIIVFGDNDVPGKQMVNRLVKRLGESRCMLIEDYPLLPDGKECKDANEILVELGDMILLDVFSSAKEIPVRGLINLASVIPVDPTTIPRIKTNIPSLDDAIGGLREGAVSVLTGKPGDGKSTLGGLFLLNAIEQGYNVCAYSGELTSDEFQQWINMQAAGSNYITLKYDPVKRKKVPVVPQNVADAIMKWYDGKFFLFDNQEIFESNQSEAIIDVFTMAARKHDCRLFLVDNLMTSLSDADEETKAQGKFMNALKRFANRFKVHVIVVSHPRKTKYGETIKQDDIGGNSATVRLAHSAIVVEKPNLRVIKSRDSGSLRLIECCYCPDSHRIYQADVGDLNHFSWDDGTVTPPTLLASSDMEYAVQIGQPEGMF